MEVEELPQPDNGPCWAGDKTWNQIGEWNFSASTAQLSPWQMFPLSEIFSHPGAHVLGPNHQDLALTEATHG